ncbi:hypothetical protein CYLTODRAFT_424584 [Cylindrobasidium torrendii FP15055 ss-10]|uniref:F-box domain-containing protein n=1 Tax=Cylindrobasidium torrendii FP15055 ss-10 TaxID=1314674 RepID=A0A0D7B4L3_9AGAR|nr:hypothetical protein CYLTODRAFT_424584 [Cylindrobasidium torrendii FP15055 ss-10]
MVTPLPVELIDSIVDQLCDDRDALKSCSLAAQTLRPRAQAHLFKDISLESATWCEKFYRTTCLSPSLPRSVRSMRLVSFPGQWIKDEPSFPLLVEKMANLQQLMMFFVDWDSTPALNSALQTLGNLTSVTLTNVSFASSIEFFNTLRCWPNLRHLTLRGIFFKNRLVEPIDCIPALEGIPTRLESLNILSTQYSDDNSRAILRALTHPSSPISLSELKEFHIAPFDTDDIDLVRTTMEQCSDFLRNLTIDAFIHAHVVDQITLNCDPLPVHHLSSLALEMSDKVSVGRQLEWWARGFRLPAREYSLRQLHLIVRLDAAANMNSPAFHVQGAWRALDDVLTRREMRMLDGLKLTFDVGPAADKHALRESLKAFLCAAFPRLVHQGRLDFTVRDTFQRLIAKGR